MKIINGKEYFSIQDIADEIGIYKLKVQRYLHDHKNDYESTQYRNSFVFDTSTKDRIVKDFSKVYGLNCSDNVSENLEQNRSINETKQDNCDSIETIVSSLNGIIEYQKDLLATKDEQIKRNLDQIENLTKLLSASQKLLEQEQQLHFTNLQKVLLMDRQGKEPTKTKEEPTQMDSEPQKEPTRNDTDSEQPIRLETKLSFTERLKVLFKGSL